MMSNTNDHSPPRTGRWLPFTLSDSKTNPKPDINNTTFHLSSSSASSTSSHHFHNHSPQLSQLSLFQLLDTTNPDASAAGAGTTSCGGGPNALSVLSYGPKLEDFLGGGGSHGRQELQPLNRGSFSTEMGSTAEIYDSELKSIAAGFLRGFSVNTEKNTEIVSQQQQKPLAVSEGSPQKKNVEGFGQRTSVYRGVTRHRWTGRYEAHLWDNSCRREGQSRKGRQVYLGGYDKEDKAARAYDLAALKYWGPNTTTNFPICNYEKELEGMQNMTRQEFVASLRRKSSGFSRGASIYRGVTRHHQHGRWQARIGRVAGNKDLYLGTFSTQEEAAEAYDIAAIKFRGLNAVTNFDISRYDVKSIASRNLPVGGFISNKPTSEKTIDPSTSSSSSDGPSSSTSYWSNILGMQAHTENPNNADPAISPAIVGSNLQNPLGFSLNSNSQIATAENNVGMFLDGERFNDNSATAIPLATPVTVADEEFGGNNGNWVDISQSYQTAKTNLSVFQTPIFGTE